MKSYYSTLIWSWRGGRWQIECNWQRCALGFQWSRWIPAIWIGPLSIGYDRKPD